METISGAARRRRSTPRALGAGGAGQVRAERAHPPTHTYIHPPRHTPGAGSTWTPTAPARSATWRCRVRRDATAHSGSGLKGGVRPIRDLPSHRKMPPRAHTAGKIMQIHTQPSRFDCFSLAISRTSRLANSLIPPETFSSARPESNFNNQRSARLRNWIIPGRFLSSGIFHVRMVWIFYKSTRLESHLVSWGTRLDG